MAHISRRKISFDIEKRITDAFMRALFSTSGTRGKARVRAILTKTEKMMLAKRLAIITMLDRDDSYYSIEKTLNVSGSTVARLDKRLKAGDFEPLCRIFNRNLSFMDYLELFLAAGLPAIGGPRSQKRLEALRSGRKPREYI